MTTLVSIYTRPMDVVELDDYYRTMRRFESREILASAAQACQGRHREDFFSTLRS